MLNLIIHTSYFSYAVNYSHEYVTFWYVWNIRTTNFEILIGMSFSQMSNFRRVKNSHVFVIPVKNSFELFTCVTNTCEFFTSVTDSFESESQTNLSQVWKRPFLSRAIPQNINLERSPLAADSMVINGYRQRNREPKFQIHPLTRIQLDTEASLIGKFHSFLRRCNDKKKKKKKKKNQRWPMAAMFFDRSDFGFGSCKHSDQYLKKIRPVVLEEMR